MIREQLYHKTVKILYDAYMNDTLEHGNCCACAVGNLVYTACEYDKLQSPGFGYKRVWGDIPYPSHDGWATVFLTEANVNSPYQKINPENYDGLAKEQIDSTGYTWQELAKIEYAFETADKGNNDEDYMFNGLVAVLEVLKEIHQVTDEDLLTTNTNRFREHYKRSVAAV